MNVIFIELYKKSQTDMSSSKADNKKVEIINRIALFYHFSIKYYSEN